MSNRSGRAAGKSVDNRSRRRWTAALVGGAMVGTVQAGADPLEARQLAPVAFTLHDSNPALPRKARKLGVRPVPVDRIGQGDARGPAIRARLGSFRPNTHLRVCFRRLSNAPDLDSTLFVRGYNPLVLARGKVLLAAAPVNDACMSSGFGPRHGRQHKGLDLSGDRHDAVFAAGPGIVREAGWGRGYGRYVVIDHGHGVYTRYAHLQSIADGVRPGSVLGFGETLGAMGSSGNSTGVHLHYEVLSGEWGPKKAFGLTAHNPLDLPAYTPARADAVLTIDADLSSAIPN